MRSRKREESKETIGYGFGRASGRLHESHLRFFLAALSRPAARSRYSSARAMAASRGVEKAAVVFLLSFVAESAVRGGLDGWNERLFTPPVTYKKRFTLLMRNVTYKFDYL